MEWLEFWAKVLPGFFQGAGLIGAAYVGLDGAKKYISRKREEKKFDLAVKAYSQCRVTADIILNIKNNPHYSRDFFDNMREHSPKTLGEIMAKEAERIENVIANKGEEFNELYELYSEVRLFLGEEAAHPLETLLVVRNKIISLSSTIQTSFRHFEREFDNPDMGHVHDMIINLVEDAIVQIWEHIELSPRQKDKQVPQKEGTPTYNYLNQQIKNALTEADKVFPSIVN